MNTHTYYSVALTDVHDVNIEPGLPLVVDQEMQVIQPILLYLWSKCFRFAAQPILNTANAFAEDLRLWWDFLSVREITWSDAQFSDLTAFIEGLVHGTSSKTGRVYGSRTRARRIGTVVEFYKHAFIKNWPQQMVNSSGSDLNNAVGTMIKEAEARLFERQLQAVLPNQVDPFQDIPVSFWPAQYRAVANLIGPLPDVLLSKAHSKINELEFTGSPASVRNRLWCELVLHVGLRPGEPAAISIYSILDLSPENPESPTGVTYFSVRNKGGGIKRVRLPNFLLSLLISYIEGDREQAVKAGIARGHYDQSTLPSALFLNSSDAGHNAGLPMKPATFYNAFKSASDRAARLGQLDRLAKTIQLKNPNENGEFIEKQVRCWPHMLRHTFAIWNLVAEKRAGNPEPYKTVSSLMGHKNSQTTKDIYAKAFSEYESGLSDRVVESIHQIVYGKQ